LTEIDIADNRMSGKVPDSIGQLILLETIELNSNLFDGPLPSSMSRLILLEDLYLNVATLTGPLPDFSQAASLANCDFMPSQMCIIPEFVPANSKCDFSGLPICEPISDCVVIAEWLPNLFDAHTCCQVDGVSCEEDRVVSLDLSPTMTGTNISGIIPINVGELDELQQLYLQHNFIEGNLPLSMSNISSLQIVDISNNFISGVLPFVPLFELIGIGSNMGLSLPIDLSKIDLSTIIDSPTETPDPSQNINENNINLPLIIGISTGALVVLLMVIVVAILYKRREQGKQTTIEVEGY
jgi:hypothetical protein